MSDEQKPKQRLEIGHVLFIDIVGYSKLLNDEQSEALHELNEVVRITDAAREAEAAGQLTIIPTGDGMALVFTGSVEDPVECALQISQALRAQPSVAVRMGIHSGPVHHIADVNRRDNIAGAGINIAQRVMDCGDAGHILVSKRVADDLAQYRRWQPYLHELGDVEVKHGVVLSLVNLYAETIGNPAPPPGFGKGGRALRGAAKTARKGMSSIARTVLIIVGLIIALTLVLAIVSIIFTPAIVRSLDKKETAPRIPSVPSPPSIGDEIDNAVRKKIKEKLDENLPSKEKSTPQPSSSAVPEKSVAVLPFENFSDEKSNAYFADGVQDEILTDLAKIADLKVISRTSVMQYKDASARNLRQIGEQLGVAHVLEGSVQRAADKVRVNAQLIDARTDAHEWAENYDRPLNDVFAIQSEIAGAIAQQLQARLSPSEKAAIAQPPTTDVVANDLYVRARALDDMSNDPGAKEYLLEGVGLLEQALQRDPNFLLAQCLLAETHSDLYWFGFDHTAERLAKSKAALEKAEAISPNSADVHMQKGLYAYHGFRDYQSARAEFELAKKEMPNSSRLFLYIAVVDRRQARWDEALKNMDRAVELDPRNFLVLEEAAFTFGNLKQIAKGKRLLERAIEVSPKDYFARSALARVDYDERADTGPWRAQLNLFFKEGAEATTNAAQDFVECALAEHDRAAAQQALTFIPAEGSIFPFDNFLMPRDWFVGLVARCFDDEKEAQKAFTAARAVAGKTVQQQPDYAPAWSLLGMIDAGLGRKDEAIREGKRACELLPISKDSWEGPIYVHNLALTYAWVGDNDHAIEQLSSQAKKAIGLSYGELKLDPMWDSLRGDSRFDQLTSSLAPKS